MTRVPTIDLRRIDADALRAIDAACADHGFFLLTNHGLDEAAATMWRAAEMFFTGPSAVKRSVLRTADNPFGYYDRELTKQKRDLKEVFDFQAIDRPSSVARQRWPGGGDGEAFRAALTDYFRVAGVLAAQTLRLVCTALGVAPDALDHAFGDRHTSTARLNYYPAYDPLSAQERGQVNGLGDMALHHHTDPGAITLLLQDDVGGLQTRSDADGWIDVPADPAALVVNMGDVMQVWTNDRYKAALHRVQHRVRDRERHVVSANDSPRARYSTPYFFQPASDTVVCPLDFPSESKPRYRSFSWREYIQGRIDDNYADLGEDDIQISRYRMA